MDSSIFILNNSLATKIKNLDGHVAKILTLIEIQFRIWLNLNSSIFVLN